MILLLDVGNSRLKWAGWNGSRLEAGGAEAHGGDPAGTFLRMALPSARSVWVSQVLGAEAERELAGALHTHYGFSPRFARTQPEHDGLCVAYRDPRRLGVDRWLAMVATWTQLRGPFCVVSAGTALTFDAVDGHGEHLGGLIGPGLVTAQKAIVAATSFGVAAAPGQYTGRLGRDTESCVREAALHACVGMVERALHHGAGARIITGGDASALLPHLGGGWDWRPHLVLEGLLTLSRRGEQGNV